MLCCQTGFSSFAIVLSDAPTITPPRGGVVQWRVEFLLCNVWNVTTIERMNNLWQKKNLSAERKICCYYNIFFTINTYAILDIAEIYLNMKNLIFSFIKWNIFNENVITFSLNWVHFILKWENPFYENKINIFKLGLLNHRHFCA